jgi:hypothetical protein
MNTTKTLDANPNIGRESETSNEENKAALMQDCLGLKAQDTPMAKKVSSRALKRYQEYRKRAIHNNSETFIKTHKMIKSCAFLGWFNTRNTYLNKTKC